jgi:hypothetical protein
MRRRARTSRRQRAMALYALWGCDALMVVMLVVLRLSARTSR